MLHCLVVLLATLASAGQAQAKSDSSRPNILWVIGDDLGPDLGCYGTPLVKTPHLDRLAREGTRFTHAFTTAPVCSPSRSALMTGMYQTSIGAHQHRSNRDRPLPEGVKMITDCFRAHGYFTANVRNITPEVKGSGKTDFNFKADKPFDGDEWSELKQRQPFFAEVNFQAPHRGGDWNQARKLPDRVDPDRVKPPPYYPDHKITREDWATYLDAVHLLDTKVGVVLRKLEEDGLATNTVVIFLGDNGRCMVRDKQWLYDGLHIPLIVRSPFAQHKLKPGSVRDDLVSGIDISATSLHLAGIPLPKNMQGQVFFGPGAKKREYIIGARDRCDATVDRIRSVRTERYNYIRNHRPDLPWTQHNDYKWRQYPVLRLMTELNEQGRLTPEQALFFAPQKPVEELYDLRSDPHQIRNLAASPKHKKVLRELGGALDRWIESTGDLGAVPEESEQQ